MTAPGMDRAAVSKGALWSAVENVGLAAISVASLVVYARFLSAAEFGTFSVVLATVELMNVLTTMLFHDALVQREDVTDLHFDTAFTFTMGLSVALVALSALVGPHLGPAASIEGGGGLLLWTSLCIPASAVSATVMARQRRELEFKALAVRSIAGRVAGAALGIVLVALGAGIWGLVAQQVLIALVGSAVLWFTATKRPRLRFRTAELRELIGFGAAAVGALLLGFAVKRTFVIISGLMLGAAAAGYLNLAFRMVDVFWALASSAVSQVALPVLARLQNDPQALKRAYRSALQVVCVGLYPCFAGMALVAPELTELLFGAKWLPSAACASVLALLGIVRIPKMLMAPLLTAVGRPRSTLATQVAELVLMLALFATVGARSLELATFVWVAREIAGTPVMMVLLRRATDIRFGEQLSGMVVPVIASSAMGLAVWGARQGIPEAEPVAARLSILIAVGVVSFVAALWASDRRSLAAVHELFLLSLRGRKPSVSV